MADLNLAVLLRASVDKLTGPLKTAEREVGNLGAAAEAMEKRLSEISGQKAQVDAFKAAKTQTVQTTAAWKAARAEASKLGAELGRLGPPTRAQVRDFEAAQKKAARLKEAHERGEATLQKLRVGLGEANISTRKLAEADRALRRESEQVTAALAAQKAKVEALDKMSARGSKRMLTGVGVAGAGVGLSALGRRGQSAVRDVLAPLASLDDAAARIRSMPGVTEQSVQKIMASSRAWSREHADSAADYARASYEMLSAGLNAEQAMAATEVAMATAKATGGDAAEVAQMVAVAYNNLGDKSKPAREELARMGDILTATQQAFQLTDMNALAAGMKYATSAAIASRMPFKDAAIAVGALNSAGLDSSTAGTAMAAAMTKMNSASKRLRFKVVRDERGELDLLKTLDNLEAKVGDLTNLSDKGQAKLLKAFDVEGQRAIIGWAKMRDQMAAAKESDPTGAAVAAQAAVEAGASQQAMIVENNINDAKIALATQLLPTIKELIPAVTEALQGFGRFAENNPGLIRLAGGVMLAGTALATTLGPLLMVGGGLTGAYGGATKLFAAMKKARVVKEAAGGLEAFGGALKGVGAGAAPVMLLTAALAALAYAIYDVTTNWEEYTGQNNTGIMDVSPEVAQQNREVFKRIKDDEKFRELLMKKALDGDKASRELLQAAMPEEQYDKLFARSDSLKRKERDDRILAERGLIPAAATAPAAGASVVTTQNNKITISQLPGENAEALARRLMEIMADAQRESARGALHDGAGA